MTNVYSDIPIWAIVAWVVFCFALAWLYYLKKSWLKEVKASMRWIMFILRGSGLSILGILLANFLIQSTDINEKKPYLISVIDNSSSMLNYKDSNEVPLKIKALQSRLDAAFKDKFNVLTYDLNSDIQNIDSLSFNGEYSNFSNILNNVYNDYYGRNIGGLVFYSDGNYNQGVRPTFSIEKFKNIPVFSVAVGDTIAKTDQRIENVIANDIAFLDNTFPIEVTVEGVKLSEIPFTLMLLENGKKINEKRLNHSNEEVSLTKIKFLVDASSVGVKEYLLQLSVHENEYNIENNVKRIYLEVLDDRSKVLLIAEELHPDLGAIKLALASEKNIETKVVTGRKLKEVDDISNFDLIVWHNPGGDGNARLFERVAKADKPVWYIVGPGTSQATLNRLSLAPFVQTTGQSDNVGIGYNNNFNLFELSKSTVVAMNDFPPMIAPYGQIKYPKNAAILGYQKVGSIAKPEPLYFFGENKTKYAVTFGNGLWNWRLGNYQQNESHEAFNEIIQKTVQYLIIKDNKSRLRISIPQTINTAVNTVIEARYYNKSYEPVTDPKINFTLTNSAGEKFEYSFLKLDNYYQLDLGRLDFGRYEWEASVKFNDEIFLKSGSFAVEQIALESQSTRANHQLMNQLAVNQKGVFYRLAEADQLISDIESREDILPIAYEQSVYEKLMDNIWWLLVLILIFGSEWVLRRYNGGY
jgi:hypothetical protein